MKILLFIAVGLMCAIHSLPCRAMDEKTASKPELWINNFEMAKKQAVREGKDILLNFTGSDWCGWCIRLKKEVFSSPEFTNAAPRGFVLMEVDFPRDGSKITPEVAAQNERLQADFKVEGKFPTIILLDSEGKPYAQTGYFKGAVAANYLEILKRAQAGRMTRDAAWKKAESAQGLDKAKYLAAGLAGMDDKIVAMYYGSVTNEIWKLDPEDSSGFLKRTEYRKRLADLVETVREASIETCEAGATVKLIDDFISTNRLTGEDRQLVMMLKLGLYPPRTVENINKALVLLDEVTAIDAESAVGKEAAAIKLQARMFKKRMESPAVP